jgi:serine/threonine protein kinase
VTDTDKEQLICPHCHKEHPQGESNCPVPSGRVPDSSETSESGSSAGALDSTRSFTPAQSLAAGLTADSGSRSQSDSADPLIGTLFADKYDILSLLGEGGMSKVYRARHRFMKRTVAVKLLHESATRDPMAKARFQQEAEAASALNHQNVVTVHDFGFTPSGQAFFVMDCLDGQSLEEMLAEGEPPLSIARAIEIFTQGCDGLDHAHRKGIVHRDIKPSNLVVIKQEDGSDLVKLVDFGIAKVLVPSPDGEKPRQLTQTGEVFGTPAYMSPEQCSGTPLDGRSDLYSFGCMMYEALSGQPPLLGETFINTIVKQLNERPRSFTETAPHAKVPPHVEAVVMKCLEKDPADRYASAQELKQALFDAAFVSGVKGLRFGAVPEPKSPGAISSAQASPQVVSLSEQKVTRSWRLGLALTLAALAVVAGGVSTWLFLYPGPESDRGTPFNKMLWQYYLSRSDDLMHQQKYSEAIKDLEQAKSVSLKFGDDAARLENTLNKLGEACGLAHDYAAQESINNQLTQVISQRVYREFDLLMSLLKSWEQPSTSSTGNQELALQASASAARILHCTDKLSIRSRQKEEILLKKSIKVFDSMEAKDWKNCVDFRVALADDYRVEQQFDDARKVLDEAIKLSPENPSSQEGWRAKTRALMLLAILDRSVAINNAKVDHARQELETCLGWLRSRLPSDKDLLKQALGGLAITERLYHTKEHDEKAQVYEKEARALE